MLWPRTRRRHVADAELGQRLADARKNNPESEAWLALVEAALRETEDGAGWAAAVPELASERPAGAPLLHGARITVDRRAVRRFVTHLSELAPLDGVNARRVDAVALLQAAVCFGVDGSSALRVVGQVAALPLLHACARSVGHEASAAWWEGYCPVCGAWPTLAEFRGLERKRWLRCGRCGTGWEVAWLRCPFCGETNHEHLGYLAPADGETTRKVEVCDTCKGYVKAEPTVRPLPWWGVLLDDAATVPLDVAALDRGYHRPERPGYALDVRIVARRSSFWTP
jgi:FdhE protein